MPCNYNLEAYLDAYISAAGLPGDPRATYSGLGAGAGEYSRLFLRPGGCVSDDPPARVRYRDQDSGWQSHVPRDWITQYLRNGGRRELAQQLAAHESPRTHL
jgi:integrase/recombinase XerD